MQPAKDKRSSKPVVRRFSLPRRRTLAIPVVTACCVSSLVYRLSKQVAVHTYPISRSQAVADKVRSFPRQTVTLRKTFSAVTSEK